jgi:hypothetical protein
MKDECSGDARSNGNDRTRHPVWENAKGDDRDAGQCSDLDEVENHPLNMHGIQAIFQPGRLSHGRNQADGRGGGATGVLAVARRQHPVAPVTPLGWIVFQRHEFNALTCVKRLRVHRRRI